jgi:hypothetical protein
MLMGLMVQTAFGQSGSINAVTPKVNGVQSTDFLTSGDLLSVYVQASVQASQDQDTQFRLTYSWTDGSPNDVVGVTILAGMSGALSFTSQRTAGDDPYYECSIGLEWRIGNGFWTTCDPNGYDFVVFSTD